MKFCDIKFKFEQWVCHFVNASTMLSRVSQTKIKLWVEIKSMRSCTSSHYNYQYFCCENPDWKPMSQRSIVSNVQLNQSYSKHITSNTDIKWWYIIYQRCMLGKHYVVSSLWPIICSMNMTGLVLTIVVSTLHYRIIGNKIGNQLSSYYIHYESSMNNVFL